MKKTLREMMAAREQMLVPCVYDALSAKAMELCGFNGVLISGGAMSYVLGVKKEEDFSADEMIRITEAVAKTNSNPGIVDAADGHGESPTAVFRNVRRLALAGASAVTIDDGGGDFCPGLPYRGADGVRGPKDLNPIMEPFAQAKSMTDIFGRGFRPVIEKKEYLEKINAAVKACEGTDCLVIARCEAYDTWGFEGVVDRLKCARELGAEMWTVCLGMWAEEEGRLFMDALGGWAKWPDIVSKDHAANVSMDTLKEIGFDFVTCHIAEKAAMYGMEKFGKEIFETRRTDNLDKAVIQGLTEEQIKEVISMGTNAASELEKEFIRIAE